MDKDNFEIWMMGYLSGELGQNEKIEFENFLLDHPEYNKYFDDLGKAWNRLDELKIPEPSENMDQRFFNKLHLEIEKRGHSRKSGLVSLQSLLKSIWKPQLAYGILLLATGLSIGYFLNSEGLSEPTNTAVIINKETEEVREQLVLTLLEQPSANKRLQGVNEANKIEKVDEKVIKALLQTLNSDPNVNVRLAAIESLTNYVENPMVREGLVQSIVKQDSPIVQVTLANLMVALQEKKSVEPFKKLMRSKQLDTLVKKKLERSIRQII